jgi:hypothetical protein
MSPLLEDTNKLRDIASSWGIPNAETIGINQLKLKLKDIVAQSDANYVVTKRGIKEFTDEIRNMGTITKFRSLLQKSIDRKIIGFNHQQNAWFWLNASTGEFSEYIVPVMPIQLDQKNEVLFEFFRINAELFDIIEKALKGFTENKKTKYDHLEFQALKSFASSKGIATHGRKRPEIETDLLAKEEKPN